MDYLLALSVRGATERMKLLAYVIDKMHIDSDDETKGKMKTLRAHEHTHTHTQTHAILCL